MDELGEILQQLVRFAPDALVVVDSRGTIIFTNETTNDMFCYAPETLVGKSIETLVPERFRIRHGVHVGAYARDPARREMGARLSDLFARRADGSEFPAGIRLAPFRVKGKSYIAAAIRDVTEQRAVNEALVGAREEADRANRAKSRFLATASHDLRQPLQTIRLLNASMLKLATADGTVHRLLNDQELAIEGMTRLLNALLDISRLESGAVEPKYVTVPLQTIFDELQHELESIAEAKGLELRFTPTTLVISTDQMLFAQLLQNIVGNAVKYTERGFVSVDYVFEGDGFVISVVDTGIGIPGDKLEHIFDEYYQVDTHGVERLGVGLGLAIVREVARLLGYSINVSSRLAEGTRVKMRIPRQRVVAEIPDVAAERSDPPFIADNTHAKCRLVLLEDNDSVRTATELFLTLEGYDTKSAGSLAEAEPLLNAMQDGDVFISDYHLESKLTGLEVLRELRARKGKDVPAILLSGDLQSMLRVLKTEVPNCRFLSKPVDTKALLAAIAELGGGATGKNNPA